MNEWSKNLGPKSIGAEILTQVAKDRFTGTLYWIQPGKRVTLVFVQGRADGTAENDAPLNQNKAAVSGVIRTFAAATVGECQFAPREGAVAPVLGLDTLGEALVGVMTYLSPTQMDGIWFARTGQMVEATPLFEKLSAVAQNMIHTPLTRPIGVVSLSRLVTGADDRTQRAWAMLLALGGLKVSETVRGNPTPLPTPKVARSTAILSDPKAREFVAEIESAHAASKTQDHYGFLGVLRTAKEDEIRKVYFEFAKRWHSDRFVGVDLGEAQKKADELFQRAAEAQRILCDSEQRKSYDFTIDRQAKGLPTDVSVIMDAEENFRKGQKLLRQGQAQAAESLLRKAVEQNKGEGEFLVYLGYAIYGTQGTKALAEAKKLIEEGQKLNEKLDVAHEFLGRMMHAEGRLEDAQKYLKRALQMNPKNREAERELRLISMRANKETDTKKNPLNMVTNFFKK